MNHIVLDRVLVVPSGCKTSISKSFEVIGRATPSYRYEVGVPGARSSVYAVKRLPAETVWVRRELVGEADRYTRQARQLGAVEVGLAGDGEVHLPEPQFSLPWEMRIGQ